MWLRDRPERFVRLAAAMAVAGLTAACFQPVYGERSITGGSAVREAMATVDVAQIDAPKGTPLSRMAVETRNQLVFDLTGGGGSGTPTYRLVIRLIPSKNTIVIDPITQRTEFDVFSLDASYTMVEIGTGKTVLTGSATSRATYNVPGQEQRFMRARGGRAAENEAAASIADQIRTRLASYFVAGT